MKDNNEPKIIEGGLAIDGRGIVRFINDFDFKDVKRFYQVDNFATDTIRAFHGHLKEAKYAYVVKGTAIVCVVPIKRVVRPSKQAKVQRFILSAKNPQILFIPPGFANGFRFLENDSSIIFFSTSSLEESKGDDYRFDYDYWGESIWVVENR